MSCHECKHLRTNFTTGELRCAHPAANNQLEGNEVPDWCPFLQYKSTASEPAPLSDQDRIKALEDRVASLEARFQPVADAHMLRQPIGAFTTNPLGDKT